MMNSTDIKERVRHVFFVEPRPNMQAFKEVVAPAILNSLSQSQIDTSKAGLELLAMQTGTEDQVFAANLETLATFHFLHDRINELISTFNRQRTGFQLSYLNERKTNL